MAQADSRRRFLAGLGAIAAVGPEGSSAMNLRAADGSLANSLAARIATESGRLLGRRYLLDPLGEGAGADIDDDPLWRDDAFDCLSLVETVLARATLSESQQFPARLAAIRYRRGEIDFGARNHFMELDWVPNNIASGVLSDVTASLPAPQAVARGVVTRRQWYEGLFKNPLQRRNGRLRESDAARRRLQQLAATAPAAESVSFAYARLREMAAPGLQAVVNAIPAAAVVLIIRPNTSLFGAVGAVTQVSHLGFAIPLGGRIVFRHASSRRIGGGVIDVPLQGYLQQMQRTKSFTGIKVLEANPHGFSRSP